jgi:hypothetical protein
LRNNMENLMLNDMKELFQAFILPQFEGLKGDIRALDSRISSLDGKFEAKIQSIDTKVDSFRRELLSEIHRVEQVLSADFVRLEQKIDHRFELLEKTK